MRVAVIGFGFSGLMVTANLVRQAASEPLQLYLIAPELNGLGVAYGTADVEHLLNVRVANMGAWGEEVGDFARWLTGEEGKYDTARRKVTALRQDSFAPRALYGDYLVHIWHRTQDMAIEKNISLKLVPATATRITQGEPLTVMTDRGDAIAVDYAVLATGNEIKPILTQLSYPTMVQNPWKLDAAKWGNGPVVVMGTGLTAIDAILSLRKRGYGGEVIAISRNGLFPQPHVAKSNPLTLDRTELMLRDSLASLLHYVRSVAKTHPGDWRDVVDGLRPHTQALWQKLKPAEQKKFFMRLFTFWNIHRHRMAPDIAALLQQERAAGTLKVIASRRLQAGMEGKLAKLEIVTKQGTHETILTPCVINCTGPELNPLKSTHGLLPGLLRDGLAEAHATGLGFAADPHYLLWGAAYPRIYAIGSLMTGQFLESTAVPELRVQAAAIAKSLLAAR